MVRIQWQVDSMRIHGEDGRRGTRIEGEGQSGWPTRTAKGVLHLHKAAGAVHLKTTLPMPAAVAALH